MILKDWFRLNTIETLPLLTLLAGGAFSFYQLHSSVYKCGWVQAGTEIRYWLALSAIQSLLFVGQGVSVKFSKSYRIFQQLSLPLLIIAIGQVSVAYPRIFIWLAILATFYWYFVWFAHLFQNYSGVSKLPNLGSALTETILFVLAAIIIHSIIVFPILHTTGLVLDDQLFAFSATVSVLLAAWIVRSQPIFSALSINQIPPLALLIIIVLRAKLPDGSYDTLFYKATLPIMIADWRTAITGTLDHTLLGTNFLEIMNSQFRIIDPDYSPALTSTLAFIAMWLIAPVAIRSLLSTYFGQTKDFVCNIAILLLVSLTEPLVSAGSAYHEPMLGLLIVASFFALPVSWLFMGAAVASKITTVFILPLIVGLKIYFAQSLEKYPLSPTSLSISQFLVRVGRISRNLFFSAGQCTKTYTVTLFLCALLSIAAVGEQFYRNLAYTGRLLGVTETLSSITDPDNKKLAKPTAIGFDSVMIRGFKEKLGHTFIHVLTLNRWIKPTFDGFHILPSSRLIAIVPMLTLTILAFPELRRNRLILFSFIMWCICAYTLLQFVSQGRHLLPLSLGAAIVIALIIGELTKNFHELDKRISKTLFGLVIAFVALGDQMVGSFINTGWDCRRNFFGPVAANNYDIAESGIEKKLKHIVSQYRANPTSRLGNPPTILCEDVVERMHYLDTHYIYAEPTLQLNQRHLAANVHHNKILHKSLLAICFKDPSFPNLILAPNERQLYEEVEGVDGINILVSKPLMSGSKSTSLVGDQLNMLPWISPTFDLIENWDLAKINENTPADTPSGKGAYILDKAGEKTVTLIAPYSFTFRDLDFKKDDQLEVELAMQYANSDGMRVDIVFETSDGNKQIKRFKLKPKPEDAEEPKWQKWRFPVEISSQENGSLTISASSPSGNPNADWAVFRKLKLIMVK